MRVPLFVLAAGLALQAAAQRPTKIGLQLRTFLEQPHTAAETVDLFVRGDASRVARAIAAHGGRVKMTMRDLVSASVPVGSVEALAQEPAVSGFEFRSFPGIALNDSMRVKNHVNEVQEGLAPLHEPYDGTGVLLGIIDTGIDFTHPDFLDSLGRTRVLRLWDQNLPYDAQLTPQPYGYGQAFDSTAINAGTCPSVDQPNQYGHGTTVAGTAGGNGRANGMHKGVAPNADLIIVNNDLDHMNWTSSVTDAVKYMFDVAAAMDRPIAINISLGNYYGSHDGLDAAALFIDSLLNAAPGRVIACAAGNSRFLPPYHLSYPVGADTTYTWFRYKANSVLGIGAVYFELWADTADLNDVHFGMSADRRDPTVTRRSDPTWRSVQEVLGQQVEDTIWSYTGNRLGVAYYLAELRGGQYHMDVAVPQPDSSAYNFRFNATGQGRFSVWSSDALGTSAMEGTVPGYVTDEALYRYPDTLCKIVDSWACSDAVITVANYNNEQAYFDYNGNWQDLGGIEGEISYASSNGPTRDGRLKPDVATTGDVTFSPAPLTWIQTLIATEPFKVAPGGFHIRGGGTSIASPVVTGTAALYLQKCPYATHDEVREAIINTAFGDAFTGSLPNVLWGNGKLNTFDALVLSNPSTTVDVFGDNALCPGDSVLVSGPGYMASYQWSTGDSTKLIYVDSAGPLWLVSEDLSGCKGWTDTLLFVMNDAPPAPSIAQFGNTLQSSPAFAYQWFFENTPIGGADQQTYDVTISGNYYVQVADTTGCTANSDTLFVLATSVQDHAKDVPILWPDPASTFIEVHGAEVEASLRYQVLDPQGRVVVREVRPSTGPERSTRIDVSGLASGHYFLRADGREGVPMLLPFSVVH
ncbi:MAG: S8 family peptidase [Flavobacteriales bacterium]|nr:S8 family peptidase [Flavobacteriales bacterium]